MKISTEDILKLAHLARLDMTSEEAEDMKTDMTKILDFVGKIEAMNLEGVEPLVYMTDRENVLRKDEPSEALAQEDVLANAPSANSDYFRVPKVKG